jgi:hypothetical protein
MMIGHDEVREILEKDLPPVTLLRGPRSVGKTTLALHLADRHGVSRVDRYIRDGTVRIEHARAVNQFLSFASFSSTFKLVVLTLDGATEPALHALLKTLEEPPPAARIILTAAAPVLSTVDSRAQTYTLGLLPADQLAAVLTGQGLTPTAARRAAIIGAGQVDQALAADTLSAGRATALAVMAAVAGRDHEQFDRCWQHFDDDAGFMLVTFLEEAVTGRWRWYAEADTFGLRRNPARLRKMLVASQQLHRARSRLALRAALEPFLHD